MAWWNALAAPIGQALGKALEPVNEWQRRKTIQAEGDLEIEKIKAQATLEAAKMGQIIEGEQDLIAQKQMQHTHKDEFLMFVFVLPFVLSFLPWTQPYIEKGFSFLNESTPIWYQAILLGILASTFGLRWLVSGIVTRMTGKK